MRRTRKKPAAPHDVNSIGLDSLYFAWTGLVLWLRRDREDFWVYLGKHAGWGRFTNSNRMRGLARDWGIGRIPFELAEIVPADAPQPHPQFRPWRCLGRKGESREPLHEAILAPTKNETRR